MFHVPRRHFAPPLPIPAAALLRHLDLGVASASSLFAGDRFLGAVSMDLATMRIISARILRVKHGSDANPHLVSTICNAAMAAAVSKFEGTRIAVWTGPRWAGPKKRPTNVVDVMHDANEIAGVELAVAKLMKSIRAQLTYHLAVSGAKKPTPVDLMVCLNRAIRHHNATPIGILASKSPMQRWRDLSNR